jgi:hypothetical protein
MRNLDPPRRIRRIGQYHVGLALPLPSALHIIAVTCITPHVARHVALEPGRDIGAGLAARAFENVLSA